VRKRISLNPLTIKQCNSMEEQIRIAAETGFGGIGLRGDAIARYLSSGNSIESLKGFVEKHGLMITDVGSLGGWQFTGTPPLVCRLRLDKPVPDEVLERQVRRYLANVRDIGCEYVLAVSAINEEGTVERAVEDFARLCDLTAEYELKVALEFVGFGKQVNNVRIAWDIIREADRVNGGLLFDTFHCHMRVSLRHPYCGTSLHMQGS
jgi:sugar phosphate isomerase/epimerase